jgi:hypothetical protein
MWRGHKVPVSPGEKQFTMFVGWLACTRANKFIPKLLLRCGLIAWTRFRLILRNVLALSEWAVRVGQRLQSRFGKSGAARKLGLVQIIVEASAIRGVFQNT